MIAMTDIDLRENASAAPATTTQRALRLRIIPGIFLAIFTWIGAVDSFFSPLNTLVCMQILVAGVSTYGWFYAKWQIAWIGTFIDFALTLAGMPLASR